jgi:DNA transformation protein and related proteins
MAATDSFAEFLREQLEPMEHVTMRRMFGKTGLFCDGVMFGMVRDNTLYFRVDDDNRVAFDEPDELVTWARSALAAASRVAAKRPRRRTRT